MTGMSRYTGRTLEGRAHLAQSISDILTTPKGTRVMRREYGSYLMQNIDAPLNGNTLVDLYIDVAEALDQWEPRILLQRVQVVEADQKGRAVIRVDFRDADGAGQLDLDVRRNA